ncbi:MAG: TIM barrel protein [Candidatus Omnitrophica bacterium]|nr:TIM barrel protein [Candidatus Omnitrophota bacterium]
MMIRLGPAGSGGLGNIEGVKAVKKKGLNAMEIEFTYGVRMPDGTASAIGKEASRLGILLSVHAPYYINLASSEKEKVSASRKRILESAQKADLMGAECVVFHAGFYQGRSEKEVYKIIKDEVTRLLNTIKKNKWNVELALETTGKKSQFGKLDELLRLHDETGSSLCVDFAHLLARDGKIDYKNVFDKLEKLKNIHAHFSGIEFTEKGEKRHRITSQKDLTPLLGEIVKRSVSITIINESPDPFKDSLKTKKLLEKIKKPTRARLSVP